jgi:DNA ligase-1
MADLRDGESVEIKGSAAKPYILKNIGGVYSCSCPAWRNQSRGIEQRTCKHLRQYRGEQAEQQRLGRAMSASSRPESSKQKPIVPAILLAESWSPDADVTGWWLSEKLDGVRAYWNGTQFVSRQGNRFYAPDWFVAGLPNMPLDGELWLGRKAFQRTVSIVRRQGGSDHWRELRYVIFDAPGCSGVFENRLALVTRRLAEHRPAFAEPLHHHRCRNTAHLQEELNRIVSLGGEGLMLRQPGSRYEVGRSTTLLKAKRFHDAEACVIGHQPGAGRHKGRLGALAVVLPDGTEFAVGTGFTDAQREQPPAVGSTITFRYQELTDRGVPRFPSFVRVRQDAEQPAI